MKPNWYALISRALEEGARAGWNRAHKYVDIPEPDSVQEAIVEAQWIALCEVIDFDEPNTGLQHKSN